MLNSQSPHPYHQFTHPNYQQMQPNHHHWSPEQDQRLKEGVIKFNGKGWKKIALYTFPNGERSKSDCVERWRYLSKVGSIKGLWTAEEDRMLVQLVEQYGPEKWVLIASRLGSRTGKQCRERWHNHLNPQINKAPFTYEEEAMIFQLYSQIGSKWAEMAKVLPGRSDNAIKNHFNTVIQRKRKRNHHHVAQHTQYAQDLLFHHHQKHNDSSSSSTKSSSSPPVWSPVETRSNYPNTNLDLPIPNRTKLPSISDLFHGDLPGLTPPKSPENLPFYSHHAQSPPFHGRLRTLEDLVMRDFSESSPVLPSISDVLSSPAFPPVTIPGHHAAKGTFEQVVQAQGKMRTSAMDRTNRLNPITLGNGCHLGLDNLEYNHSSSLFH